MFLLLDVITRGKNIAGIEEAAQGIFGVSAADLTVPQAAYLAGLPQSPIVYSPYTADGQLKRRGSFLWLGTSTRCTLQSLSRWLSR